MSTAHTAAQARLARHDATHSTITWRLMPLLLLSSTRHRNWIGKIRVSQRVIFHSASLLIVGAYLLLAARALGLDTGPMSGFDNAGVDAEFFAGTRIRSNFLINAGTRRLGAQPHGAGTGFASLRRQPLCLSCAAGADQGLNSPTMNAPDLPLNTPGAQPPAAGA